MLSDYAITEDGIYITSYDVGYATTNTATSQSGFTWWTRAPYSTGDAAHATTGYPANAAYMRDCEVVYMQECELEAEEFDITEVEKYVDSLKKEVVETES